MTDWTTCRVVRDRAGDLWGHFSPSWTTLDTPCEVLA